MAKGRPLPQDWGKSKAEIKANIVHSMREYGRFQGFHQGQGRQDD